MSDQPTVDDQQPLQAVVKKHRTPSIVWLIPLLTLVVGAWLVTKYLSERGPEITITFKTAEGIKKKSPIMYRDVQIGKVKKIRFSDDFKHIVLTARMAASAEPFLREKSRFWVVRPHLSLQGASGLRTLINGSYIEVDPGPGAEQYEFSGLEEAPALRSESSGVSVTLISDQLGSLNIGTPVYYKGIVAGKIVGYELDESRTSVRIHAFIDAPYDKLVHDNSHFWNISGIDASLNDSGLELHSLSILTMVFGGIAFDAPQQQVKSGDDHASHANTKALSRKKFRLYAHFDDILEHSYKQKLHFITYFDSSIHGLNVGANVEFQGIKIGKVSNIGLELGAAKQGYRIPVTLEIEPQRVPGMHVKNVQQVRRRLMAMVKQGLRAQLQTSSLLTGKLYIDLIMPEHRKVGRVAANDRSLPEIPSVVGGLSQIQGSVQNILSKVEKLDIQQIGDDLHASLHSLRHVLKTLNKQVEPTTDNLNDLLKQSKRTLQSLDKALDPSSPTQYRFKQMSRELSDMARSIRDFIDMLERHPNSVIFGKPAKGEQ